MFGKQNFFTCLRQISEVRLLLASQLPNNNYHRNAFRHSIFYQRAPTATLFIRRERLSSVGDLVMVIVHSMAHIAAKQMEDDSDPYFLRAFYKVLYGYASSISSRGRQRSTTFTECSNRLGLLARLSQTVMFLD